MADLPSTGYVRQWQIIGKRAVTEQEAAANRARGKGPRRARPAMVGVLPWSDATLWRAVKARRFPAPVRLSAGTTAWRVEDVRAFLESAAKGQA